MENGRACRGSACYAPGMRSFDLDFEGRIYTFEPFPDPVGWSVWCEGREIGTVDVVNDPDSDRTLSLNGPTLLLLRIANAAREAGLIPAAVPGPSR